MTPTKSIAIKHALLISLSILATSVLSMKESKAALRLSTDTSKNKVVLPADTMVIEDIKTGEKRTIRIHLPGQDKSIISIEKTDREFSLDTTKTATAESRGGQSAKKGKPILGITFSRIDLGLTKPHVGGNFAMGGENEIFKYRPGKTVNFGFDVLQAGYRFNREFRVFLSAGFDWTYMRLRNDYIFESEKSPYVEATLAGEELRKNRLTSTYMRLPLTFEYRPGGDKTRIAVGPIAGFLLKGTQRYKLESGDKVKRRGDFGYAPFQYGLFGRFNVGGLGIFAKYYFNDMFTDSPTDAGLQNLTFGLSLGM